MPIPDFDQNGLLPQGVHDCSIEEIRETLGAFRTTDRRCRLFKEFEVFAKEARGSNLVAAIIVNGSFVTDTDNPNDIDAILVLKENHDWSLDLPPFQYNVVSKRRVFRRYRIDLLVAQEGSELLQGYIQFFQQVRDRPGVSKGILRIKP